MEHRWRKSLLVMSALHIEQGSATSQWHLPGNWPLIHGIFLRKPPLLFKQKHVVLTDIHSSHLSLGILLFSYKQVQCRACLLSNLWSNSASLYFNMTPTHHQGEKKWTESYSFPAILHLCNIIFSLKVFQHRVVCTLTMSSVCNFLCLQNVLIKCFIFWCKKL